MSAHLAREQRPTDRRGGLLRWLIVAVIVAGGIVALREGTMNRPDPPRAERTSMVELVVRTNNTRLSTLDAAHSLWATCAATVDQHHLEDLDHLGGPRFAIEVEPALGEHAEQRLVGCLEDAAIPRILGEVVRVEHRL